MTSDLISLTEQEQKELQFASHIALARQDYIAYATLIDGSYQTPAHVRLLGSYLNALERGDIRRLAIVLPPRHSKSESTSGKWPAWCLGKDASRCVMITSYAAVLAELFSMQNRDTIATNPYWPLVFPGVNLSPHNKGREKWALAGRRESLIAAGVGGSITGLGAWALIIDDPVKNYEEATSEARQEAIYNWYTTVARTRLTPDGRIIIIMTRWTEIDLLGRLLGSDERDKFTILHLPAFSYGVEEDYIRLYPNEQNRAKAVDRLPKTAYPDPLGRHKDAPLWPERFNADFLLQQKLVLGADFEALYQGNPGAPEGNKFKRDWFHPVTQTTLDALQLTPILRARSYDLAWSESDRADYTVGLRATLYERDPKAVLPEEVMKLNYPPLMLVIEDVRRWKKEWDESAGDIVKIGTEDTARYKILIEAVASQNVGFKAIRSSLHLSDHVIVPIKSEKDKEIRGKAAMELGAKGCIFLLYPTATTPPMWEQSFLNEVCAFPNAANDDQYDGLTQLVNHMQPIIVQKLLKIPYGMWKTPFAHTSEQHRPKVALPFELQPAQPRDRRYKYDRLGWIK